MKNVFLITCLLFFSFCSSIEGPSKKEIIAKFRTTTFPAVKQINDYRVQWTKAELGIIDWVNIPGESFSKMELKKFIGLDYAAIKSGLKEMKQPGLLTGEDAIRIDSIVAVMDNQIENYKQIIESLSAVENYNDPAVLLPLQDMISADGECVVGFNTIDKELEVLANKINSIAEKQLADFEN